MIIKYIFGITDFFLIPVITTYNDRYITYLSFLTEENFFIHIYRKKKLKQIEYRSSKLLNNYYNNIV